MRQAPDTNYYKHAVQTKNILIFSSRRRIRRITTSVYIETQFQFDFPFEIKNESIQ